MTSSLETEDALRKRTIKKFKNRFVQKIWLRWKPDSVSITGRWMKPPLPQKLFYSAVRIMITWEISYLLSQDRAAYSVAYCHDQYMANTHGKFCYDEGLPWQRLGFRDKGLTVLQWHKSQFAGTEFCLIDPNNISAASTTGLVLTKHR